MNAIPKQNDHGSYSSQSDRREGFADVARWIALDPDGETFIYRKFDKLASRNLLYLQTELIILEKQLDELDIQDANSDDMDLKNACRKWEVMAQRRRAGDPGALARIQLIEEIRAKMKEYYETLLVQSEVEKLKKPNERVLDAYRHWFKKPFPALGGQAKTFLDAPDDLVALKASSETDHLSLLLRRHWPLKEEVSREGLGRIGRFDERSISAAVSAISILVAAILLVGSITGLYFASNDATKLGMIAAFTAAFALSVGLMTNASRAEIFAATAAYAAVLVVFVSGDLSSSGKDSGSVPSAT